MNIPETLRQRLEQFSASLELSPNRDRAVYHCVHAGLLLVAAVFVLAGFAAAVWPAIVLGLVLTARDAWQVQLSRRFSFALLLVLALYFLALIVAIPFRGLLGPLASLSDVFVLLLALGSVILWLWAADGLYDAHFRLPPEDSGPW